MPVSEGPTTPASKRSSLDGPPPLPDSLRTKDYTGLASTPTANPQVPPTGELAAMVVQRGALAMKVIESLATMVPSFAPAAANIISQLQQGLITAMQQGQQGQGQGQGQPPGQPAGLAGPAAPPPPPQGGAGAGTAPPPSFAPSQ